MPSDKVSQEQEELNVFQQFARECPQLPLVAETAEKRDPKEPDILCDLETGEKLAFELVSAGDVTMYGALQKDDPVPANRKDEIQQQLQIALRDAYHKALAAEGIDRPERFESHIITVNFDDDARLGQCKEVMPRVIDLLNERGRGCHTIEEKPIRLIRCEPSDVRGSHADPMFCVGSSFCSVGIPFLHRVKCKLSKSYETDCPIHLIAYSDTASDAESDFWKDDLVNLLQSKGMGRFVRIWVFGRMSSRIVFDSDVDLPCLAG